MTKYLKMKIRNGFVSNSSSSSFIVNAEELNGKDLIDLHDFLEEESKNEWYFDWIIYFNEEAHQLAFYTFMDNTDLVGFLKDKDIDIYSMDDPFYFDDYQEKEDWARILKSDLKRIGEKMK